MKKGGVLLLASVSVFLGVLTPSRMQAVPSYARQTGLPCSGCHYTPPELNAAGRRFKLLGYGQLGSNLKPIESKPTGRSTALELLSALPLSAWFETSFTSTNAPQPGTQNGNFEFPQDVSLFLSGAWFSKQPPEPQPGEPAKDFCEEKFCVGSFLQVTYTTTDDHFSIDNTDVRIAKRTTVGGKDFVYGLTLNNNPTVEDLWNTTPAWGFPFIASDVAPTPTAAPIIQGGLAQDVAGLGGYAMWDEHLYLAAALYRSAHVGGPQPNPGTNFPINIRGVAPYWRAALQWGGPASDTQFEVGTYGLYIKSTPGAVVGLEDRYTDWAFDLQLDQTVLRTDVISLRGTYVRENSDLAATLAAGGAEQSKHHLSSVQANAEYHFGNRLSATVGWFNTTGTADPVLFPQSPITGSANGDPKSAGFIGNLSWWPIQNLQIAAQYIGYTRFNGGSTNYDGAGRDAGDNNTTYLLARFIF